MLTLAFLRKQFLSSMFAKLCPKFIRIGAPMSSSKGVVPVFLEVVELIVNLRVMLLLCPLLSFASFQIFHVEIEVFLSSRH